MQMGNECADVLICRFLLVDGQMVCSGDGFMREMGGWADEGIREWVVYGSGFAGKQVTWCLLMCAYADGNYRKKDVENDP